jgi:probable rRNA maturation factor
MTRNISQEWQTGADGAIQVSNRQRRFRIFRAPIAVFCGSAMDALGKAGWCLSVSFVGRRTMRTLNREYRKRDYATDVLSFPYPGELEDGIPFLGEIVIAPEVALEQAGRWRTGLQQEVRRLLLHGILHLRGWDHEKDAGEMMRLEKKLLRRRWARTPAQLLEPKF